MIQRRYDFAPEEQMVRFSDAPKQETPPIKLPKTLTWPNPEEFAEPPFDHKLARSFEAITDLRLIDFINPNLYLDHPAFTVVIPTPASVFIYQTEIVSRVKQILTGEYTPQQKSSQLVTLAGLRLSIAVDLLVFFVQIDDLAKTNLDALNYLMRISAEGRAWFSAQHPGYQLAPPHLVEQEWFRFQYAFAGCSGKEEKWVWAHREETFFDTELNERIIVS